MSQLVFISSLEAVVFCCVSYMPRIKSGLYTYKPWTEPLSYRPGSWNSYFYTHFYIWEVSEVKWLIHLCFKIMGFVFHPKASGSFGGASGTVTYTMYMLVKFFASLKAVKLRPSECCGFGKQFIGGFGWKNEHKRFPLGTQAFHYIQFWFKGERVLSGL